MNLFSFKDDIFSTEYFIERLSKHIMKGDTLYLELDVMAFGKLADFTISKKQFLDNLFYIFKSLVGEEGNIIVPSFSYSWGDNSQDKVFDVENTMGKVGVFPEYLRKKNDICRTRDPMFSFITYGPEREELANINNSSFGKDSLFRKLHMRNAKLVTFGLKQYDPTFVHYIEQYYDENIEKLSYRYLKKFSGKMIENGIACDADHYSFMRYLDSTLRFTEKNLVNDLRLINKLTEIKIGAGVINISDCDAVFQTGLEGLKQNEMYFMSDELA